MNAIVYDLELVKRFKKGQLSEIIEIGACKIDLAARSIIDEFQVYIRPRSGYIPKSTRKFISMSKDDLDIAVPYQEGIERFADWIGQDYYLCSWGKDDKVHVVNECLRKKVKLDWFRNYNDIQKPIGRLLRPDNPKQQLGLKEALSLSGLDAVGTAHRGIDDAVNTGKLLLHYLDQIQLLKNELSATELSRSTVRRRPQRPRSHPKQQDGSQRKPTRVGKDSSLR